MRAQKSQKKDLERMQGLWKPVFSQSWGQKSSNDALKSDHSYLIRGAQLVERSRWGLLEGSLKLDTSEKPRAIDVTFCDRFKAWKGIYTFEGDKLKICIPYGSRPRPTKFGAEREDGGDWIQILERQPNDQIPKEKTDAQEKEKEARMRINGNLFVLGMAMHRYHDENGHFPRPAITNKEGKPLLSWRVALLPYLGQEKLHKQFKLDEPWDSVHNKTLLAKIPKIYATPAGAKKVADATYLQVFVGKNSVFEEAKDIQFSDVTDGTSSTLMIIESGKAVPWTKPEDLLYAANKPVPELGGSIADGLISLVYVDGSTHILRRAVTKEYEGKLRACITRNGGDTFFDGWEDLDPK